MRGLRVRAAHERLTAPGLAGSAALHLLAVATFLAAGGARGRPALPPVYRVSLVAAPGTPAAAASPAVTPAPTPARPTPYTPRPTPAQSPPAATPGAPTGVAGGSDAATIKTEGVDFPFPGYLRNLVAQVYTRWRPAPSSALLEAEVFFFVHRDGSVTGLQFIRRSGSFAFDLEAQGAIEAASRAGALGALPSGYGPDLLPVSFFFNPRSVR